MKVFRKTWVLILSVAILAVALGFLLGYVLPKTDQQCDRTLSLINPDAACDRRYVLDKREYDTFRASLTQYLDREVAAGRVTRYGVHFRDLDNGPTFSINQNDKFVPASLMKLPVLLAYLARAQEQPGLLDEELVFTGAPGVELTQYFPPEQTIEEGKVYTVRELLHTMIAYSDNASYDVLIQHLHDIDPEGHAYLETMQELGIIEPTGNLDETLSAKSYASIFRALYNASYLTPTYSELALSYLADSTFAEGLRGGVPDTIKIAHKFGERFGLPGNQKELHDCGIVYYPENPYLLCVMVEGHDFSELASVIQTVSDMVYGEVNSRRF